VVELAEGGKVHETRAQQHRVRRVKRSIVIDDPYLQPPVNEQAKRRK